MKKKLLIIFAMLLCISLCFLLTSCDGFGEYLNNELSSISGSMDMIYVQSDDKTYYRLVGMGTYDKTNVIIPDKHNGLPVKEISNNAFSAEKNPQAPYIKSIVIPNSVESIGDNAFAGCSNLKSVTIPESVRSIGSSAFSKCESLTSIIIPESITSIGDGAFSECESLASIIIPRSVTNIGSHAFYRCSNLTIYASVTDRPNEWNVSWNSSGCTVVWGFYAYDNGVIYALLYNGTLCVTSCCGDAEEVVIPESIDGYNVTFIQANAFSGCSHLKSVTIPNTVTSIGNGAFSNCTSLASVNIPNSVTGINNGTFSDCTSLAYVNIPDSVTYIGKNTFLNCFNLTSVNISDSVKSISAGAFSECTSLKAVYITDISKWCAIYFGDSHANPLYYANNLYLNGELVTELVIPEGVTRIGDSAFPNCTSLTNITIPDSVTKIGSYAFYKCSNLTSITIPDSVTSIGSDAFRNCSSLNAVYITDISKWCAIDFYNYDANPLYYTKNLYLNGELVSGDIVLEGITRIGSYALYNYRSITSITIPEGVTSIGQSAFYGCSSLNAVYITDISKWCAIDFYNYDANPLYYTKNLYLNGELVSGDIVLEGITRIGKYALYNYTGITSITIPDSVTSIGSDAFSGCFSLTDVYYTGTEEQWAAITIDSYNTPLQKATIHYSYSAE